MPSRSKQCELLGIQRSGTYYHPRQAPDEKEIREAIDKTYQTDPCLGARRIPSFLKKEYGIKMGRKRVLRIKQDMGLRTIYQHPKTSRPGGRGKEGKFPHRLKDLEAIEVDDVWTTAKWLDYYNNQRPHATLENKTPAEYRKEQGFPTPPSGEFF